MAQEVKPELGKTHIMNPALCTPYWSDASDRATNTAGLLCLIHGDAEYSLSSLFEKEGFTDSRLDYLSMSLKAEDQHGNPRGLSFRTYIREGAENAWIREYKDGKPVFVKDVVLKYEPKTDDLDEIYRSVKWTNGSRDRTKKEVPLDEQTMQLVKYAMNDAKVAFEDYSGLNVTAAHAKLDFTLKKVVPEEKRTYFMGADFKNDDYKVVA
jgi:hypothetical protein